VTVTSAAPRAMFLKRPLVWLCEKAELGLSRGSEPGA
jgi:hypothetical protein